MTDHPTPFDPAAFLSECARVHEAATPEKWFVDNDLVREYGMHDELFAHPGWDRPRFDRNARAIAHYHNTYGALLDVARGLVEELRHAREVMSYERTSPLLRADMQLLAATADRLLAPLSRLAAAGGGR